MNFDIPQKPKRNLEFPTSERAEDVRERVIDPQYLPTLREVIYSFDHVNTDRETHLSDEQLRAENTEWQKYLNNGDSEVFEVLTEEFVQALSLYLSQRIESLGGTEENPVVILEVGAGNGRLTHFLQQKLDGQVKGSVKVIATDSGTLDLKTNFPVEKIDQKDALQKYKPQIVICSWMPEGEDFTKDFRNTSSVQEYVLIGEGAGGCCGSAWETWGNESADFNHEHEGQTAPYLIDGFELDYLEDISETQLCRSDSIHSKSSKQRHSSTNSFKRIRINNDEENEVMSIEEEQRIAGNRFKDFLNQ